MMIGSGGGESRGKNYVGEKRVSRCDKGVRRGRGRLGKKKRQGGEERGEWLRALRGRGGEARGTDGETEEGRGVDVLELAGRRLKRGGEMGGEEDVEEGEGGRG